jgi:hypothetical protein
MGCRLRHFHHLVGNSMIKQGSAGHPVTEIVMHTVDTPPEWRAKATPQERWAEVRRWHVEERGWRTWGYHFGIDRDGTILTGRPVTEIGAGVVNHNRGVIHITLFGGKGGKSTDRFETHYTEAQDKAARALIADLHKQIGKRVPVNGHNQYAAKACPCFNAPKWFGRK